MLTHTPRGPVKVYRNLRNGLFSLQVRGLVVGYGDNFIGRDVTFRVSRAGRLRAVRSGQRNVHAYAVPTSLIADAENVSYEFLFPITYNPFEHEHFVRADTNEQVADVAAVLFIQGKIHAIDIKESS